MNNFDEKTQSYVNGHRYDRAAASGLAIDRGSARDARPEKPCLARIAGGWCGLAPGHAGDHDGAPAAPRSDEAVAVSSSPDGKP